MSGAANLGGSGEMGMGASAPQAASQPAAASAAPGATPRPLTDDDMPGLYTAANTAAIKARATFFTWLRAELVFLALAAIAAIFSFYQLPEIPIGPFDLKGWPTPAATYIGAIHGLSIVGIITGVLGALALAVRGYRWVQRFDTKWYEARAVAESVKSLAWRYAVGGRPFPLGGDVAAEDATRKLMFQRLDDTLTDVLTALQKNTFTDDQKITPPMQALRDALLPIRQKAYKDGRIEDQEKWYLGKIAAIQTSAKRWHTILVWVEGLGIFGAVLLTFHVIPFNIQGAVGAIAAGIISWTQAQRFQDLEAAYRVTGSELGSIKQGIDSQTTEPAWSTFVDESEEACSREHRLWRATRD